MRGSSGTARGSRASSRVPTTPATVHTQSMWQTPAPASTYRWQPPEPSPAPSRREQERDRVREAAAFCADSLSDSWQAAVADRITSYAQTAWERLSSRFRRKRSCKQLARMAREILNAKDQIHKVAGELAGGAIGAKGAALAFTRELVSNIPLNPIDAKMVAVARGIQITGVLLCVITGRELTDCQCFIDLALAESKERVNQILVAGMSEWTGLAGFGPQATRSVR